MTATVGISVLCHPLTSTSLMCYTMPFFHLQQHHLCAALCHCERDVCNLLIRSIYLFIYTIIFMSHMQINFNIAFHVKVDIQQPRMSVYLSSAHGQVASIFCISSGSQSNHTLLEAYFTYITLSDGLCFNNLYLSCNEILVSFSIDL